MADRILNLRAIAKMQLEFASSWIADLQMQVAGDFDESRALNPDVDPLTEANFSLDEAIQSLEAARKVITDLSEAT